MNKIKATVAVGAMMLTAVGSASPAMAYLHPGSTTQHPASGSKSIAEKYAVNTPGADDKYYYRTC